MKPLVVLLSTFLISLVIAKLVSGVYDYQFAGIVAMSVMLVFTSIAHFTFTKGMMLMIPDFIPCKKWMVYITGIMELIFAAGLLLPQFRALTAWLLILFFILLLPANISAAVRRVDYQKGTLDGAGTGYLWFRIPLQLLFIIWIYWCTFYLT